MKNKEKPLHRGLRKAAQCGVPAERIFGGGHNEYALWGKGATARKQKESRSFERLSCSLARFATQERTNAYVTVQTAGA